jgi:hypothetical protein
VVIFRSDTNSNQFVQQGGDATYLQGNSKGEFIHIQRTTQKKTTKTSEY